MDNQPINRSTNQLSTQSSGMTLIVKTVTRLTVGLIMLYGLYITFHGHLTPGGGFAGGVILALSFVHLILAFGKDFVLDKINETISGIFESIGAILFLTISITGFLGGVFFKNVYGKGIPFNLFSAGIILPCNLAIMLKVGLGLFSAFLCLILFVSMANSNKKE